MRKVLLALTLVCALMLILAVPAAAAKPMEVSGEFIGGGAIAAPVTQAAGSNCFLTIPYKHVWGEGAFDGSSIAVWEIVSHGACVDPDTGLPYPAGSFRENLRAWGTFTGRVCDGGVWQEGECKDGIVHEEGGFTFVWVARVRPADPPAANMFGQITIMHGTGGLQDLHGTLETEGRAGESGGFSGQIHFEPQ